MRTTIGEWSFGVESSGAFRSILAASTASDTLLGAISGVSNGFQINITDANAQTYKFHNGSQQSMTLDSSGRLLLGTTATTGGTQKLQVVESTGGRLVLARDDTTVSNGADLGIIQAYGNDNDGNYQEVAAIHFAADLNHGTNDKPGRIVFKTTSDGGNNSSERLRIDSTGHLTPGNDDSQDLGSDSLRWRNVFTTDLQLSNKGKVNDVDGTWGDYTIQEGENDLFLLNRRNGKKFKFNLTEVV